MASTHTLEEHIVNDICARACILHGYIHGGFVRDYELRRMNGLETLWDPSRDVNVCFEYTNYEHAIKVLEKFAETCELGKPKPVNFGRVLYTRTRYVYTKIIQGVEVTITIDLKNGMFFETDVARLICRYKVNPDISLITPHFEVLSERVPLIDREKLISRILKKKCTLSKDIVEFFSIDDVLPSERHIAVLGILQKYLFDGWDVDIPDTGVYIRKVFDVEKARGVLAKYEKEECPDTLRRFDEMFARTVRCVGPYLTLLHTGSCAEMCEILNPHT